MQTFLTELTNDITGNYFKNLRKTTRARLRRKSKKFIRKYTWDADIPNFNHNDIMNNTTDNRLFLGLADFDDFVTAEILNKRVQSGKTTVMRETHVLCNRQKWATWAEEHFKNYIYTQPQSSSGNAIDVENNNFIKFDVNSNTTSVRAFGDEQFCQEIINKIEQQFSIVTSHIEWIYGQDGSSVNVPLNRDRLPVDEMYEFLKGETLESYYDRYMKSSANILLLIGPPGTGKTTFIRGLLAHTNSSAIVSYDSQILEKDSFFARFIEEDASVMILEDSDTFLKSRTDGNTMMHRFLNVGDGLVTTKGKKMIFSTNLPSIRDIDPALVRPGRCFDIIEFKPLSLQSAQKLANKLHVKLPERTAGEVVEYSIAEIFNGEKSQPNKPKERKVGFL
jgi:hypothetical protein